MDISIDKYIKTPLYRQIAEQIEHLILSGELPAGYVLPPERKLAEQLKVNRTTILNAYRTLKADGLLSANIGSGTMVEGNINQTKNSDLPSVRKQILPMYYDPLFADVGKFRMSAYEKEMLKFTANQSLISFSVGILNQWGYPFQGEAFERLYKEKGKGLLSHTPYRGLDILLEQLRQYLMPYNIKCLQNEMMITSGSQQGIGLVADIFIEPGDVVVVEDPTYFLGKQVFEMKGARVIGIPMEDDGMDIRYLEQVLKTTQVKLIYTMPNLQNPTNCNMSTEKKTKLLQLSYEHRAIILEDGAYNDLRFDHKKPITLKSMDYNQQVIYIGTFSKVFSLGVRVGFILATSEVIKRLAYIKHLRDIHTSSISQWLVYDQLVTKNMEAYVDTAVTEHQAKLNDFVETMEDLDFKSYGIDWIMPSGGIYLWIQLPETVDGSRLLKVAKQHGIVFAPGQLFSVTSRNDHHLRINFAYNDQLTNKRGLKLLLEAIKEEGVFREGETAIMDTSGFAAI